MKYIIKKCCDQLATGLVVIIVSLFASCKDVRNANYEAPQLKFERSFSNGFSVPEGWEVTLWAESPAFYNPTNIDVDEKGRVWVTEAVNYRNFNNDPEEHLHFEEGDRVMILEDTNGDGVSDKSKVFVKDKDLLAPMGIAVIGNKVFVSASPSLFVYTDENGDDIPDKKEEFLTGFGGFDHDHGLHSLIAGPDGKLLLNVGNAGPHHVTDKAGWKLRSGSVFQTRSSRGKNKPGQISDDGRIWVGGLAMSVDKDGTGLKVVGHNLRNSYEVALDSYGNMWQNDNDDEEKTCRFTYLMEGGNAGYFNAGGQRTWRADRKPGQDIFSAQWHQEDPGVMPAGDRTGAGAPTGVVVYEGDAFGTDYRGMVLSADAGRNVIFAYQPSERGAGFNLERNDLIASTTKSTEDYIWSDIDDDKRKWFRPSDVAIGTDGAIYVADWYDPVVGGHQMKDKLGYGRIYRITPKGKELKVPKIDVSTTEGQIAALLNPAINVRNLGFEKLLAQGEQVVSDVKKILDSDNPYHRSRAVWLLAQLGNEGKSIVLNILKNEPDPRLRVAAYRALKNDSESLLKYAAIGVDDPSAQVRREVAISLRDVPWKESGALILDLYKGYDGKDRWYLEALGMAMDGKEDAAYTDLLPNQPKDPANWSDAFASMVWRIHPKAAITALKERALAESVPDSLKSRAVDALAFINDKDAVKAMFDLKDSAKEESVVKLAGWWLDFRKSNNWYDLWDWQAERGGAFAIPEEIAKLQHTLLDKNVSLSKRVEAGEKMAVSSIGGRLLISLAIEKKLSEEIIDGVSKAIFASPGLEVRTLARGYFNIPAEKSYSVPEILKLKGDAAQGQGLFMGNCVICHNNGKVGNDIGPDLSSIGQKLDRTAMLDRLIHPNASVGYGYNTLMIKTKEGQAFYGFLLSEGETTVLKDMFGGKIVIPTDKIESKVGVQTGIMPTAASLEFTDQNLADLSTYLLTLKNSDQ